MKKTLVFLILVGIVLGSSPAIVKESSFEEQVQIGTCVRFTSDRQSCLQCVDHYHLFEGQCYRNIHGCNNYIFGSICKKCNPGFILVNNECCDKHCMARIFKNYKETSEASQQTEEQRLQRLIVQGYESTISTLTKTVITTRNYKIISTSNQVLNGVIRFQIRILLDKQLYRAIADFHFNKQIGVTIIEFRLEKSMGEITENVLTDNQILSNNQAKSAFEFLNSLYGLRIYGCSLVQVSVTAYKYGSQFIFIYIHDSKSVAFIITIFVPNRGNPYSTWIEERNDTKEIQKLVKSNLDILKVEKTPEFQIIKTQIAKENKVEVQDITIKEVRTVTQNTFDYTYLNKINGKVFEEKTEINLSTKKVVVLSHKEVISPNLKEMKLPESPVTKVLTGNTISSNTDVSEAIRYLEKVQPSLASKEITNVEVQEIGNIKKITLMQKKDNQISRVVVMKNEDTQQFELVDQSIVKVEPPKKTTIQTTKEGTNKITTNNVQNLIKIDQNVKEVIQRVETTLPAINFTQIKTTEKQEGNLADTYTFVVDSEDDTVGGFKHQVTAIREKKTGKITVVDVEQLESKPILEFVKRPVTVLAPTEYQTLQVKTIVKQIKDKRTDLKDQVLTVTNVNKKDKKFVNSYEVTVKTEKGEQIIVSANENLNTHDIEITDVRENPVVQNISQPIIEKVSVSKTTGVKTIVTTNKEEIKKIFVTPTVLQEVKTVSVKPKVTEIISVKKQIYDQYEVQTVVVKTQTPKQYLQIVAEKPVNSEVVKIIEEQVIYIEEGKPILPKTLVYNIPSVQFEQVIKVDKALKTVTEKIVRQQPIFKNVAPLETQVEEHKDYKTVIFVYQSPETPEKKRVVTQYNKVTTEVVIKETTVIKENIKEVYVEKDVTNDGHVTIISNSIQEIEGQDTHIAQIIKEVSQQYPTVKEQIVSVSVTQTETSNNYVVIFKEKQTGDIVEVDLNYNNQDDTIQLLDVQKIPDSQILLPVSVEKPTWVLTTQPEIIKSTVVQNVVVPVIKQSLTTQEIKSVTKVTQTQSAITTSYDVTLETTDGDEQTATVVVNNFKPQEVTLVDIVSTSTAIRQNPVVPVIEVQKSNVSVTDSANVVSFATDNKQEFTDYLAIVAEKAQAKQPLLKGQNIICFTQKKYESNVQVIYLASTQWGNIQVVGFVSIADHTDVILASLPSKAYKNPKAPQSSQKLETVDIKTCDEVEDVVVKHSSISLVAQNNNFVSIAIDYVIQTFKSKKIIQIIYSVVGDIKIFTFVYESSQNITERVLIVFNTKINVFTIIEQPVAVQIPENPTTTQVTTQDDGSTVVLTNSQEDLIKTDESYPEVISQIIRQYSFVQDATIKEIVANIDQNKNLYTIVMETKEGKPVTVQTIFKKDTRQVIVKNIHVESKPIIAIKPRIVTIVDKRQYPTETIQKVLNQVQKINVVPITKFTTQQITEVTQVVTTFGITYGIKYETSKGPQTVVVSVKPQQQQVTVVDFIPSQIRYVHEPAQTVFEVEPSNGVEIEQTNDITIINSNPVVQSVKKVLVERKIIEQSITIVETVTKKSNNKIQTTIVTQSPSKPNVGIVFATIYDTKTNQVQVLTQKNIQIVSQKIPKIQEVFPTIKIPKSVYKEIIGKDIPLQNIISAVTQSSPQVEGVQPTNVVLEKFGNNTICTCTYESQSMVYIVQTINDKATIIQKYEIPKNIKPVVFETSVQQDGSSTVISNSVQQIVKKQKNINTILADLKLSVPSMNLENVEGIRVETDLSGHKTLYISTKGENGKSIQIVATINEETNEVILIDVQTIDHEEVATQPEHILTVKLSESEINQEKIEQIITTQTQITEIRTIKTIQSANETVTGYAKTFDTIIVGGDDKVYNVKIQKIEGQEPKIIHSAIKPLKQAPKIFDAVSIDGKSGILTSYTNNKTIIENEKAYKVWAPYLEKEFKLVSQGFVVQSQSISKLQRTTEVNVRFADSNEKKAQDFILTVDRTGKISVLEKQDVDLTLSTDRCIPTSKPSIEIVGSEVIVAMRTFPVIDSSRRILESADYTFENRTPQTILLKKYNSHTEITMIYKTHNVPESLTRVVMMAETTQGAGILSVPKIPKILDISVISENITPVYTRKVVNGDQTITFNTNNVEQLKTNSKFIQVKQYIEKHQSIFIGSKLANMQMIQYSNAFEYTITATNEQNVDFLTVVSVNKDNVKSIVDFHVKSSKSATENIPIKQIQGLSTLVPVNQYESESIILVKSALAKYLKVSAVDIQQIKLSENTRVQIYETIVKVPGDSKIYRIKLLQTYGDKKIIILSSHIEISEKPFEKEQQSETIKFVDTYTGFIVEKSDNPKLIKANPNVVQVKQDLIRKNIVSETTQIIETTTQTSAGSVKITILTKEPERPTQSKVIVATIDRVTSKVDVLDQKQIFVPLQTQPTLKNIIKTTVINKQVITQTLKQNKVLQQVTQQIYTKLPELNSVQPEQITQQVINAKILTTVVFPNVITTVSTDQKTQVSTVISQQKKEVIPKIPVYTSSTVNKEGKLVTTTTDTKQLKETRPSYVIVIQKITRIYEIIEETITQVTTQTVYQGVKYEIVVKPKNTNEVVQITVLTNGSKPEDVQIIDYSSVPGKDIINQYKPKISQVISVQEQKSPSVQNILQTIERESSIPNIKKVLQVKQSSSSIVTQYQVTVETTEGIQEVVTVTTNPSTKQTIIIDHRPVNIVQTKPLSRPQQSVTTVKVDKDTGIKTTQTTNVIVIKENKVVQSIQQQIKVKYPEYQTWNISTVTTQQMPSQVVQATIVLQSNDKTVEFTVLDDVKTQTIEIIDQSPVIKTSTEPSIQKTTGGVITNGTKTQETSQIVIFKSTYAQAASNNVILVRVMNYITQQTNRFQGLIPQKVIIENFQNIIRIAITLLENKRYYQVIALYSRTTDQIKIFGGVQEIAPVEQTYLETVVSGNGRTTIVSNNVKQATNVYSSIPQTLTQAQQLTFFETKDIKNIRVDETSIGEKITLTVDHKDTLQKVVIIHNQATDKIIITETKDTPKVLLYTPQIRPKIQVSKETFTSQTIETIVSKIQSVNKLPAKLTNTQQIVKITKAETPFGTNFDITYNTPNGKVETIVVSEKPITKEVKILDYFPAQIKPVTIAEPSYTQFYIEPTSGIEFETTSDKQIIAKNPVTSQVTNELVKQNVISTHSVVIETSTSTTQNKIVSTVVTINPTHPEKVKTVITLVDKNGEVKVIGQKEIVVQAGKPIPKIEQIVPRMVYTKTVIQQVQQKNPQVKQVIKQVVNKHPEVKYSNPDVVTIDKIGETTITTVTYEEQKIVSQVVTNLVTKKVEEVNTYKIVKENIKPVILETTVNEVGETIVTSNSLEQIIKVKPEVQTAIVKLNQITPVKIQEIQTVSVNNKGEHNVIFVNPITKEINQIEFIYRPEDTKEPIILVDSQQIFGTTQISYVKDIVYETIQQTEPKAIQILEEIRILNSTSNILKNIVTKVIKIEKAGTNLVQQYKTIVQTSDNQIGTVVIQIENEKPHVVDIVLYKPEEVVEGTVEIVETTDPRTDVVKTVYANEKYFTIDEQSKPIRQFLQQQTKTHKIQSVVKQHYGPNDQYTILLKNDSIAPQQVVVNFNSFTSKITLMENKTVVSKDADKPSILTKGLPITKELILTSAEQQDIDLLSKLSNVNIDGFTEVKKKQELEKDTLFMKAIQKVQKMYNNILKGSTIARVNRKADLDKEKFKVFFSSTRGELYEANIMINRITEQYEVESFSTIGNSEEQVQQSQVQLNADIAYGYIALHNYSEDSNVAIILKYIHQHFPSMSNALLQSVDILRLEGDKMNYRFHFKNDVKIAKFIIFYEEKFERILVIRSNPFEMGNSYKVISETQMLEDPYFRSQDKWVKENHVQVSAGASILHTESKRDEQRYFIYRTIYVSQSGKTFRSCIKIHSEDPQDIVELSWNEIIEMPVQQQDPQYIQTEQVVKLTVKDLNSNARFSEIHNQIKLQYGELKNAQLVVGTVKSTLSEVIYYICYSINNQYYTVHATYNAESHKITIGQNEKVSLTSGYTGIQSGQGSQQILEWLLKEESDLKSGVIMSMGKKQTLLGTLWNFLFKLPTKNIRIIIQEDGNNREILQQISEEVRVPELKPFPQPLPVQAKPFTASY